MKKVFKVLIIIIVAVVVAVSLYWGFFYLSEKVRDSKLDNERINGSTTLSKYIEYHDTEHTRDTFTSVNFYAENIKCELLKDKKILYFYDYGWDNGILILDDYTIYETAFKSDKVYSNGEQYKKIELEIEIKQMKIFSGRPVFITKNNKYYWMINKELSEINTNDMSCYEYSYMTTLLNDNSIRKVISRDGDTIIVIKDDGQVYKQEYKYNNNNETYNLLNETLLLANKDYGNIIDCEYNQWQYEPIPNKKDIITVVSDTGLYYLKQTSDQQYIDTEPTKEMVASDIYNKYKSDIKYMDATFIFTTDNNIIKTGMLCRDIDKEVK